MDHSTIQKNSRKPSKSSIWKPTATNQHIATTNRFTPLHNLQDNNAESNGQQPQEQRKQIGHSLESNTNETSNQHRKGMKIPTVINGRLIYSDQKSTTRKKDRKRSQTETRASHKVKILGDSHFRGIASKIDQYLTTKFEIGSWIKPEQTHRK